MSIWNKLKSFSFDKNEEKIFGIKSAIIWGQSSEENAEYPLLYISKPKGIPEEEYKELLNCIEIQFIKR